MTATKLIVFALLLIVEAVLAYLLFAPRSVYSPDLAEMVVVRNANYPTAAKAKLEEAESRAVRWARVETGITVGLLILNGWILLRIVRWKDRSAADN